MKMQVLWPEDLGLQCLRSRSYARKTAGVDRTVLVMLPNVAAMVEKEEPAEP